MTYRAVIWDPRNREWRYSRVVSSWDQACELLLFLQKRVCSNGGFIHKITQSKYGKKSYTPFYADGRKLDFPE